MCFCHHEFQHNAGKPFHIQYSTPVFNVQKRTYIPTTRFS
jgi:hypothetical protein